MTRYDVILRSGDYRLGLDAEATSVHRGQGAIESALRLKPWHRLPVLGRILRNHWAKRHGAKLV